MPRAPKPKPLHVIVKEHVHERDLTTADLSRMTGWTYINTMRRLNGKTELSATDMLAIAAALKMPIDDLYKPTRQAA